MRVGVYYFVICIPIFALIVQQTAGSACFLLLVIPQPCEQWYRNTPRVPVECLPPCPLSRDNATIDMRFGLDATCFTKETCKELHPGAHACYRSINVRLRYRDREYTSANYCCYDEGGDLITDPWKGGGRAELEAGTITNAFAHCVYDLVPYEQCRYEAQLELFYEKRPTDDGRSFTTRCQHQRAVTLFDFIG